MPNSISDESMNVWKSYSPGNSLTDCEIRFWNGGGPPPSLQDAKDVVMTGAGSIQNQEWNYWRTRAMARGIGAGTQYSVSDYKLFAQANGG